LGSTASSPGSQQSNWRSETAATVSSGPLAFSQ